MVTVFDESQTPESLPTILMEDVSQRNEFEKYFICSDGTQIASIYQEQIHYFDEKLNAWVDSDNSLSLDNEKNVYANKSFYQTNVFMLL